MSLGLWDAARNTPFVGSIVKGIDTLAGAAGLDNTFDIQPESSYAPKSPESSPEFREPEPEPETPKPPPYNPSNPFGAADALLKEGTDKAGEKLPDIIPGWDANKTATENIAGGFKVITDAFGNAAKAAADLGSAATNGIKKWGPLALAGGLAFLLLRK